MRGIYTFRQHGRVIGTSENLLTTEGKRVIRRFLCGQAGSIAQSIAIGTGTAPALVTDSSLQFEFDNAPITFISPDFINNKMIFKATFQQFSEGLINEVGLYSTIGSTENFSSKLLMAFDSDGELWTGGAFTVDANRIGGDALRMTPAVSASATASLTDILLDLTGYSNSDKISFSYNVVNAFTSSIKIRLKTDSSNYFEYIINTPSVGYKITSFFKNNFSVIGAPGWDTISSVDIVVTSTAGGSATLDLDGLRVDEGDSPDPDYALVSRSVLGTPIQKIDTSPLEIEYSLDVSL